MVQEYRFIYYDSGDQLANFGVRIAEADLVDDDYIRKNFLVGVFESVCDSYFFLVSKS